MSFHALTEYINYRLKAKTRHGVHSPFVFALIENVLRKSSRTPLETRLKKYLKAPVTIIGGEPGGWETQLSNIQDSNTAVLVPHIHKTARHTSQWNEILASANVRLSIDLYKTGMLFFREEFKEKQHFVLKYPQ